MNEIVMEISFDLRMLTVSHDQEGGMEEVKRLSKDTMARLL